MQPVVSVAFSSDGKTLATAADDCEVKLWNIAVEEEVMLKRPRGCQSVKVRGRRMPLRTGKFIRLWQASSHEEIEVAEAKEKTRVQRP